MQSSFYIEDKNHSDVTDSEDENETESGSSRNDDTSLLDLIWLSYPYFSGEKS